MMDTDDISTLPFIGGASNHTHGIWMSSSSLFCTRMRWALGL